jgi:predicted O-methyltransferase YrrM
MGRQAAVRSRSALHKLLPEQWFLETRVRVQARDWRLQANSEFIDRMKKRSMLHQETLALLDFFARRARRGILEIGAYIGGGTAVIAEALKASGGRATFVTVEAGGVHEHPELPSADILADLRKTLASNKVAEYANIVEGHSGSPSTVTAVHDLFVGRGIDMLVIDADGESSRDFFLYRDLLVDKAIIVFDDYSCLESGNPKNSMMQSWIDEAVAAGTLQPLGVFQWGTWFGIYRTGSDRFAK